jgi:hypothetical protein
MPATIAIEVPDPPALEGFRLVSFSVGFPKRYKVYTPDRFQGKPGIEPHLREWTGTAWASRRTRA